MHFHLSNVLNSLALVLVLGSLAGADVGRIERPDGTEIVYYLDPPASTEDYPLVALLQGSECLRVSDKYADLIALMNAHGVAVLRVEKPRSEGVTMQSVDQFGQC